MENNGQKNFCMKCGKPLPPGAKFCSGCGTPVTASETEPPIWDSDIANNTDVDTVEAGNTDAYPDLNTDGEADNSDTYYQEDTETNSGRASDTEFYRTDDSYAQKTSGFSMAALAGMPVKFLVIAVVAVVVFILIVFSLTRSHKKTFDLEDYVTYEFSGYNGNGSVNISLDYETLDDDLKSAMQKKIEKKLKKYSSAIQNWYLYGNTSTTDITGDELNLLTYYYTGSSIASSLVDISSEPTSELTNGDEITVTFDYDEDLLANYGVALKGDSTTITVADLPEATTVDVFKDFQLTCEGASPNLSAEYSYSVTPSEMDGISVDVTCSPNENLAIGDTVTLTVDEDDFPEGYTPKETSISYTIESAPKYIQSLSEVPETLLTSLQSQAQDVMQSEKSTWDSTETFDSMEYQGAYLLTGKESDDDFDSKYFLVYKITVTNSAGTVSYFWYIEWDNPILNEDGTAKVNDITDANYSTNHFSYDPYYYYGYESLDALYNDAIGSQLTYYNVETNIQ